MLTYYMACDGGLTFEKLSRIIDKYNIPHDVLFLSDSGWECNPTGMCGIRYSKKYNTIIFTQDNGYYSDLGEEFNYNTDYYYKGDLCQNLTLNDERKDEQNANGTK